MKKRGGKEKKRDKGGEWKCDKEMLYGKERRKMEKERR